MKLYSTNNRNEEVSLKEAVFKGLPADNGLFMPTSIPTLPASFFDTIQNLSFQEIAFEVTKALIGEDISDEDIKAIIADVITFDAPAVHIEDNLYVLELFHGPSFAFKDFGARFMARLVSHFLKKENKKITILVATSGDTGSAVAQGFLNMPGINVVILYPSNKVSDIQEKQLTTLGQNITALEIKGTFDDCQAMVKSAFLDKELNEKINLSSANSINISRLIPQSFYYFYAYAQLKKLGKPLVFCTPSGNFGNLCGGLIAKSMGLPIQKFIAATNANDIVPHYLNTGKFEPKASVTTISNAMDVGNPSNFARIKELFKADLSKTKDWIEGRAYTDEETKAAIKEVYKKNGYIMCPHTAVAYLGLRDYFKSATTDAVGVFLSTAHPAKFVDIVEEIIESKITLPENLELVLKKEKKSILMENDFQLVKDFLIKNC